MKASLLKAACLIVIFAVSTAADYTPSLALVVANTNLRIAKAGGSAVIVADAATNAPFVGTVSGTIFVTLGTVSKGIRLESPNSRNYPIRLSPGQSTQTAKAPQTAKFTVATKPDNRTTGTITYVVDILPSARKGGVRIFNAPQFVTVCVEEPRSERSQGRTPDR